MVIDGFFNKTNRRVFCTKNLIGQAGRNKCNEIFLCIDRTAPALERSISASSKLKSELPTDLEMESIPRKELSPLVENIYVKTREASQNTDLDMQELLGIDKTLQGKWVELLNNMSKLTEIIQSKEISKSYRQ